MSWTFDRDLTICVSPWYDFKVSSALNSKLLSCSTDNVISQKKTKMEISVDDILFLFHDVTEYVMEDTQSGKFSNS